MTVVPCRPDYFRHRHLSEIWDRFREAHLQSFHRLDQEVYACALLVQALHLEAWTRLVQLGLWLQKQILSHHALGLSWLKTVDSRQEPDE